MNKISAYTSDYLPLPADKSPLLLLTYAVLAGFVVLFFALAPLGLAIRSISQHKKIKNKNGDKSKVNTWILLLTLSGTGILINNIILVLRMLSNYERAFSEIVIHTALNTIFSMASMIFMLLLILSWQKKKAVSTLGQKIMLSLSLFSTFILMFLLSIWQFY